MFLTAETFAAVLKQLKSDRSIRGGSERRQAPRVGVRAKVEVERATLSDKGGQRYTVQLRELSRSGIGFIQKQKIQAGERFSATYMKNDGGILVAEYEVKHCRPLGAKEFLIGAALCGVTEFAAASPEAMARRMAA